MYTGRKDNDQKGQMLIIAVFAIIVVCGFTSLTIDIGLFLRERQSVQNAVDAAALAGAQELPDSGTSAESIARAYAMQNDSALSGGKVTVTFRCIVGDRDNNGVADPSDIPAVCDPGSATFHCANSTCWSYCSFTGSNKCNTIVVNGNNDVPFYFAPVLSVLGGPTQCVFDQCNTGGILASACVGPCGGPPTEPLDVMLVIDRTSSMSDADLTNAKNGAKSVLQLFDPTRQHVGLAVLGAGDPSSPCNHLDPASGGKWLNTGLSSNYKNANGTLNTSSTLVSRINCLTHSSSQGTNLGSPINDVAFNRQDAMDELAANGRPGVKKGIIFMTDGAATQPVASPVAGNTGARNCTANAAVTTGSGDNNGFETTAANACADGSGQAVDTNSGNGTSTSCTSGNKDRHIFRDYNISLPANATITGIAVRLDAWVDSASGTRNMCTELSWNGGSNWTGTKQTANLTNSQASYTLGSSSDTWGRAWTIPETGNANFRLRITDVSDSNSRDFSLDWAAVTVHYTTPNPLNFPPCKYGNDQANVAKGANIEIFTIGFGIETEVCSEPGSPYHNLTAAKVLADMATTSADDHGHCSNASNANAENLDGDHFFCEPLSSDLTHVFTAAAVQMSGGTKLVPVYGN